MSSKNTGKSKMAKRVVLMSLITCVMFIALVVMAIGFIKVKSDNKQNADKVKELNKSKDSYSKELESVNNEKDDLNKKVTELESEKESLADKNAELESVMTAQGIKEKVADDKKIVYLTFDDGPSDLTPQFLDTLDSYGVNATFFVTYQPQHEDIYKDTIARGNSIQIHTASHDYDKVYASEEAYIADFNEIFEYVKNVTGTTPNYFRFPGGSTNSYGKSIVKSIAKDMKTNGYDFVDWNVSVGDGSAKATKDSIIAKIKAESEGKNHIVMLAHDSGTKTETLAALPEIIEYYKANGYEFGVIKGNLDVSFAQFIDYEN
ncbi:MAG: polysaccharide deacetylase family protein [Lachnospiraceae bacterium]|nr:polysaccharide deacetylase family protein [Lachnospiraceae bacterium]